ncbi:MAG: nitroreductase family protein [Bacteroidetes bacterium]|nr:nitroreductase family protein [Bacteroidota bacterium]
MADSTYKFIPYVSSGLAPAETETRARQLRLEWAARRSLRMFSSRPVPRSVIEDLIMAASSAPSGANKQPWTFCAVSNPALKAQIREAAEKEEYENYHGRMPGEWLQDLRQFGTDWQKPFLEIAPWIIVLFKRIYEKDDQDPSKKNNNYYVTESVGLAAGMFLTAIHQAGLVSLTHTPSPMNFLGSVLGRPENERPFLLIPVGYAADDAVVPAIQRKSAEEVIAWYE